MVQQLWSIPQTRKNLEKKQTKKKPVQKGPKKFLNSLACIMCNFNHQSRNFRNAFIGKKVDCENHFIS